MSIAETLYLLAFIAQVAMNVAVAFYVFPMWRQRRLSFLLILGMAALIDLYIVVADWIINHQRMPQNDFYWCWCAARLLSVADYILYGTGIILMVRHLRSTPPVTPPVPTPNDNTRNAS
ncbi:MAG: hypothetical protein ABMA01_19330 [Chthoniobacteraceae bacterium]